MCAQSCASCTCTDRFYCWLIPNNCQLLNNIQPSVTEFSAASNCLQTSQAAPGRMTRASRHSMRVCFAHSALTISIMQFVTVKCLRTWHSQKHSPLIVSKDGSRQSLCDTCTHHHSQPSLLGLSGGSQCQQCPCQAGNRANESSHLQRTRGQHWGGGGGARVFKNKLIIQTLATSSQLRLQPSQFPHDSIAPQQPSLTSASTMLLHVPGPFMEHCSEKSRLSPGGFNPALCHQRTNCSRPQHLLTLQPCDPPREHCQNKNVLHAPLKRAIIQQLIP